jgi:hypothetical protein
VHRQPDNGTNISSRPRPGLPLHFSYGTPALASYDGQTCCALADVLLNGSAKPEVGPYWIAGAGLGAAMRDLPPFGKAAPQKQAAVSQKQFLRNRSFLI